MAINQYDTLQYAQYQPLSMQEIWAPAQQLREQHDKLQEEYSQQELLGGAAALGLQKGVDDLAIATNQKYMDETKKAADELATKGFIDSGRRRNLMGLKQQYTQNVLPIQNALKERDAAIKMDREMKMKDQTYRSTFDPSKVAITDYMTNNQAFTPQGISVGVMSKDAANEFSQLKNLVSQKYPSIAQSGVIGTLWTKVNSGVPLEDIAGFIKNEAANKNIDPKVLSSLGQEMHNIVENNLQKHGAYKAFGNDENAMKDLRSSVANMAIYSIGDPKFGQVNDPMGLARAQQEQTPPGNGYLQDIQSDPEIIQSQKFNDNLNLVNHIDNKKYKKSSITIGFDYDAEVAKIKNDKTMSSSDRNNALAGLAKANNFSNVGNDRKYNEKIESLAKKYKTTDLSEIKNRVLAENEFLKVAYSQHGITGKDNYPLKNILSSISSYDVDISDLTDDKGNVNETTTKVYQHPTKGLVIQGVDKKGKVVVKKLPADIIGNPTLVKYIGANTLPSLTDQILNGNVDVNKMISSGELKVDPQNKNHYIFAKPIVTNSGEYYNNNSYTLDDLNDGIYQPELMKYINDRQQSVFNQYETRLQGQNKGYDVGPK